MEMNGKPSLFQKLSAETSAFSTYIQYSADTYTVICLILSDRPFLSFLILYKRWYAVIKKERKEKNTTK